MKRKFGLQIKFTLLFLAFMIVITFVVLLITEYNNEIIIEKRFYDYAVSIGSLAASMVTADEVLYYKDSLETDSEYDNTLRELQRIQEKTNIHYLYVIYPISETEGMYIYDTGINDEIADIPGEQVHILGDSVDLSKGFDMAIETMKTGKIGNNFEYDAGVDINDMLVSAFVPVLDDRGNAAAFIGVDMNINAILDTISQARNKMVVSMLVIMGCCYIVLMVIVRFSIVRPIQILRGYAEQISEGHFGDTINVRGHDEISEITKVFNGMSKSIKGHMGEIERINYAYQKYVPSELLKILGKESIIDVELGNRTNSSVTIFTFKLTKNKEKITEKNSGQFMEYMNLLFQATIPVIMEQGGYVQSFHDTNMTAIFKENVHGAVDSAVSISQRLNGLSIFNKNHMPQISMGITYGEVLFGIVGYEKRMSYVSLSAHISMAEFLQRLARIYGGRTFLTAGVASRIKNFNTLYHYRFVGMVQLDNSSAAEKVFDVYDGDSDEERISKERTKEYFERGVELFCLRRFSESRQAFIEVLKQFRKDKGAKRYLQLCNEYYNKKNTDNISIFLTDL